MPETKTSKKPSDAQASEATRGSKDKREFDAEMASLIEGLRIAASKPGDVTQPEQPLNVQPPQPELVSRLVKFIKKI